jgi:S1-C subfamily serine protease
LLAFQPGVIADSDHHPFYAAGIPVIHMDTDKHDDYHRPSDDPEKLNWEGIRQLAQFSYHIVDDAANRPDFPSFRREALTEGAPTWMNPREPMAAPIRLGVNWDQVRWGQGAAVVLRVNPNSPAARAGLRPGDRLIRLGSWQNGTTDELKAIIQVAMNPVPVRIERPNVKDPVDMLISLQGNPVRLGAGWMDDTALPNSVVVTHVVADSPAHRSGITAGDVIIEMGGERLASSEGLRKRVLVEPGPFEFRIERQGRIREVTVEVVAPYPQTPLTN